MKNHTLFHISLGLIISALISVSSIQPATSVSKKVTLTYSVPADCSIDSLQLFTFSGIGFRPYQQVAKKDNAFIFSVAGGKSEFYFVGPNVTDLKSIILGAEKTVVMETKCGEYKMASIKKSKINQEYSAYLSKRNALNKQNKEVVKTYRTTKDGDVNKRNELNQQLAKIDKARLAETSKYKSDFVNKVATLFAYQSYQNNKGNYEVEMEYFADHYFNKVDFSNTVYDRMSVVYEAFGNYTNTLTQSKMAPALHKDRLIKELSKLNQNGKAYKYALGAIVNNLYRVKHKNMPAFATMYVNKYYETDKDELGQLKTVVDQINANTIGAPAPDIILNNPEDKEVALSSLKGNVVLIDFWASWCGPCRRENPNVVRLYEKYKDKGFEIFGVSLDSKKDRWIQAIAADGLTWPQVSDLRGWQSNPAKVYGVRSIPTTVLIDADGNVLARKLRGANLETGVPTKEKLEELELSDVAIELERLGII